MILNLEIIHDIHDELYIHQRGSVVLTLELLLTDFGRIICIIATSPQIETNCSIITKNLAAYQGVIHLQPKQQSGGQVWKLL